jgi:hypothetical protein
VQRGAEEAIAQCAAGTLGIASGPSRANANATQSPPDAQVARA